MQRFLLAIYMFFGLSMFLKTKWEKNIITIKKALFKDPQLLLCVASDHQSCSC